MKKMFRELFLSIYILVYHVTMINFVLGEVCEDLKCSNVFDPVCGAAERSDGLRTIRKYQNICHLKKIKCRLKTIAEIFHVPDRLCKIKREEYSSHSGRRVYDFSIVGSYQTCNHTCPTYCVDTYEPACAQIWGPKRVYRPMINHCHIDLYSCAAGVNVTIQPLGKCYSNSAGLMFMSQVAALKSLGLIDDASPGGGISNKEIRGRRSNYKFEPLKKSNEEPKNVGIAMLKRIITDIVKLG